MCTYMLHVPTVLCWSVEIRAHAHVLNTIGTCACDMCDGSVLCCEIRVWCVRVRGVFEFVAARKCACVLCHDFLYAHVARYGRMAS